MGAHRDLKKVVEELEAFAGAVFDSREVALGHFSHLDMLQIVPFQHVSDVKSVALVLREQAVISILKLGDRDRVVEVLLESGDPDLLR